MRSSRFLAFDIIDPIVDPVDRRSEGVIWIGRVAFYLFLLFIVIGGVGRMTEFLSEINRRANESNRTLNQYNEELIKQIEYTREMENKVDDEAIEMDDRIRMLVRSIEKNLHE